MVEEVKKEGNYPTKHAKFSLVGKDSPEIAIKHLITGQAHKIVPESLVGGSDGRKVPAPKSAPTSDEIPDGE